MIFKSPLNIFSWGIGKDDFSLLNNFQEHIQQLDFEFLRKIKNAEAFDWLIGSNPVTFFKSWHLIVFKRSALFKN